MNENIHPTTIKTNRIQIEQSNSARVDTLKWLAKNFPDAFDTQTRVRPLKKGIMQDIFDFIEDKDDVSISKSKLRETVVMFARRMEYLVCLKCRNDRIDLNGEFAGKVTIEESELAAKKIKKHLHDSIEKNTFDEHKESTHDKYNTLDDRNRHHSYPNSASHPISSNSFPNENAAAKPQTQVIIKHKISRRIDPEAVSRMKEKLGIKKESK